MRLSGTNELVVVGTLIFVTCFMPHVVSPLVRSHIGKAAALAAVAWVALNVSQTVALFAAVLVVSCCSSSGWEYMTGQCDATKKSKADCESPKNNGKWDAKSNKCECTEPPK